MARKADSKINLLPVITYCPAAIVLLFAAATPALGQALPRAPIAVSSERTPDGVQIRSNRSAGAPAQSNSVTPSEVSKTDYFVIHSAPSVAEAIHHVSQQKGLKAASLRQAELKQGQTVEAEHNRFSQTLTTLGIASSGKKLRHTKIVLNASILRGVSEKDAKRIKDQGYDIRPARKVITSLADSVPLIGAAEVWERVDTNGLQLTGKGIRVAVIDTGVDYTHSDLGGCSRETFLAGTCSKVRGGYNFVSDSADPMDDHFHGTHVAATVAGNGVLKGVAPDAEIYAYKVLDANGSGWNTDIVEAIERSADPDRDGNTSDHFNVISLSLGGWGYPDDEMSTAIDHVVNLGVVAVVAAGNSGSGGRATINSPGCAREAITVAASYPKNYTGWHWGYPDPKIDTIAPFSSQGPAIWYDRPAELMKPDITAPGVYICAAKLASYSAGSSALCQDSAHVRLSGTSMATPHVSGVAALLLQAHPDWTPQQIKDALRSTSADLRDSAGKPYSALVQGAGRVNAAAALSLQEAPPTAALENVGYVHGYAVTLRGSAYGAGFQSYKLEYRSNSGGAWIEFAGATSPVINGVLGQLPTNGFDSADYTIRLTVAASQSSSVDFASMYLENTQITSPVDVDSSVWGTSPVNGNDDLEVYGRAIDAEFDHYILQLCRGENRSSCIASALAELPAEGRSEVHDSLLGVIHLGNDANIVTGGYHLFLTVYDRQNRSHTHHVAIYIDRRLAAGFPKPGVAWSSCPVPVIEDIDGDGEKDMLIASQSKVLVADSRGNPKPGWPITANLVGCPAVGDLDHDGKKEILIRRNGWEMALTVFSSNGTVMPGWPRRLPGTVVDISPYKPPVLADVNLDGYDEIIIHPTIVLDKDGYGLAGYDGGYIAGYDSWLFGGIAAGDVNGDGYPEIAFQLCSGASPGSYFPGAFICPQAILRVIDRTGALLMEHSLQNAIEYSAPIIADVNRDGINEIIVTTTYYSSWWDSVQVDVLSVTQQAQLPGWPVTLSFRDYTNSLSFVPGAVDPAVGDLDGDGSPEIVVNAGGALHFLNASGSILKRVIGQYLGAPTIGNIDADDNMEVLLFSGNSGWEIGQQSQVIAFNSNGSVVSGFPRFYPSVVMSNVSVHAAITDLDEDGKNEIATISEVGDILVWRTEGCSNPKEEWPNAWADSKATRLYQPGSSRCTTSALPPATPAPTPTVTPTPMPTAEPTPEPTAIPTATATPAPTEEPAPAPTAEPAPTPVPRQEDRAKPLVEALRTVGAAKEQVRLRYQIYDNSGFTSEVVTIKKGSRIYRTIRVEMSPIPDDGIKTVEWAAAGLREGNYKFCVRATDPSRNRSKEDCATLKLLQRGTRIH